MELNVFYANLMKCLVLFFPAFAINALCIAQPQPGWVLAATIKTGGKIYINPSLVKRSGEILTIEYKEENRLLDSLANINSRTIFIVDIRCASRQIRLAGMRMYDAKGKLLMQQPYADEPWDGAKANSINREIIMKACKMFGK